MKHSAEVVQDKHTTKNAARYSELKRRQTVTLVIFQQGSIDLGGGVVLTFWQKVLKYVLLLTMCVKSCMDKLLMRGIYHINIQLVCFYGFPQFHSVILK